MIKGQDSSRLAKLESKIDTLSAKIEDHTDTRRDEAALRTKVEQIADSMNEHMKKVGMSLKGQEEAVHEQTKLIERSIRDNMTHKVTYADMVKGSCSDIIDKVSAKIATIPNAFDAKASSKDMKQVAEVVDSFIDRDRRKNNLVIHNLPESDGSSSAEKSLLDTKMFQDVIKDTFRMSVAISRSFRVGKAVQSRPRLLIVTLDTPGVKHDILRMAPLLLGSERWGNIYITPDLTREEREAARKVREELAARKAAGETNLTIRKGKVVRTGTNPITTKTPNQNTVVTAATSGVNHQSDTLTTDSSRPREGDHPTSEESPAETMGAPTTSEA